VPWPTKKWISKRPNSILIRHRKLDEWTQQIIECLEEKTIDIMNEKTKILNTNSSEFAPTVYK